ncbi:MAG TPA: Fe-S cluster assembly protein SufD [Chthoniobacterales bacterium]|nr:Fe-S cluster assembly protein SufD [Chthoniobacterales bacterium]
MSNPSAVLEEVAAAAPKRRAILDGVAERAEEKLPAWFVKQQRSAWTRFQSVAMPARKDQAWRFSTVSALDLAPYSSPPALSDASGREVLDRSRGLEETSGRLVFADDHFLEREVLNEKLRKAGVIFQPLERALIEHEELFRRFFMSQPATLGSAKFAALHEAFVRSGTFLYVPRGVEIELPLEAYHWLHAENAAIFPHTLVVAEDLSKVTLVDYFRSTDRKRPGFACGVNDLIVGAGAKVTYICAQDWSDNTLSIQINATTVTRDARALNLYLGLGGKYSRLESLSRLSGEGAHSDMLAVSVGDDAQEFDARTLQDHASPHTYSDLLFKNALHGRARNTFGGLIRVEPHAHFTDAYQKVRNLLLSDEAEANSMPGLEIMADNVKCSHGATSGQIDEDEMFYLLARGIPAPVARQLLVGGFLNEVLERLPDRILVDKLEGLIADKFAHRTQN